MIHRCATYSATALERKATAVLDTSRDMMPNRPDERFRRCCSAGEPSSMTSTSPPLPDTSSPIGDVHLCDHYLHLLTATADLGADQPMSTSDKPLILFIGDHLPFDAEFQARLARHARADIVVVSDDEAVEEYSRLPRWFPGQIRRNLNWTSRGALQRPQDWTPSFLTGRSFKNAYVYHPGFFLSKVVAGHCEKVIMRESGYANYVRHRVPVRRMGLRLLARRHPLRQTWGEEPWVDEIQVMRPDQLPPNVRSKATKLTLEDLRGRLDPATARDIALLFWPDSEPATVGPGPTALIATQPIDQLGMCSTEQKFALYEDLAGRLEHEGYTVIVKPHPREQQVAMTNRQQLPRSFPIEAWTWIGQEPFDVAVSLNSTSLLDPGSSLAHSQLQLIAPDRFYAEHWSAWPTMIAEAYGTWLRRTQTPLQASAPHGSTTSHDS